MDPIVPQPQPESRPNTLFDWIYKKIFPWSQVEKDLNDIGADVLERYLVSEGFELIKNIDNSRTYIDPTDSSKSITFKYIGIDL